MRSIKFKLKGPPNDIFLFNWTVALSLVLLLRAALALIRSIFVEHNSRGHAGTHPRRSFHDMIHVKWGREVLHFPIPPLNTPLGKLRADLAAYTHLPVDSFKLVFKGAVMKDDAAPLSTFKLKENATIALIGGHAAAPTPSAARPPAPTPKAPSPRTEEGTIQAIRQELERVRETLVPDVNTFVLALAPRGADGAAKNDPAGVEDRGAGEGEGVPPGSTPTPLDHSRLSELLLQSLLRLDALHISGVDWPEARVQRKAAVREVQGVLDRLDGAWATC